MYAQLPYIREQQILHSFDLLFLPEEEELTDVGIYLLGVFAALIASDPYWQWLLLRQSCEGKQGTVNNLPSVRPDMMFFASCSQSLT